MNKQNTDQLAVLKAKGSLSPEETAVLDALNAVKEAESTVVPGKPVPAAVAEAHEVLLDARKALEATPSTTV